MDLVRCRRAALAFALVALVACSPTGRRGCPAVDCVAPAAGCHYEADPADVCGCGTQVCAKTCASNLDCTGQQLCVSGTCQCPAVDCQPTPAGCRVAPPPAGQCGCGNVVCDSACKSDCDCPNGIDCNGKYCDPRLARPYSCATCSSNAQCGAFQECVSGTCQGCTSLPDCPAPPAGCAYQPDPSAPCTCGQLVCQGSVCKRDADCPAGEACDPNTARCVAACHGQPTCTLPNGCTYVPDPSQPCSCGKMVCEGNKCQSDTDCLWYEACQNGSCTQCPPGGACMSPPPGCSYQPDPNTRCSCGQLVCPKCGSDSDCQPYEGCTNGACNSCPPIDCAQPPPGCTWQRDAANHCGCGTLACAPTCASDLDCPPQYGCGSDGTCSRCVAKGIPCPAPPSGCSYQPDPNDHCSACGALVCPPKCSSDADCFSTQFCSGGACSDCPPSPGCAAPPDGCRYVPDAANHCGCGKLVCGACRSNAQCPANETCQTDGSCACLAGACAPPPAGCRYLSAPQCGCGQLVCDQQACTTDCDCPKGVDCDGAHCNPLLKRAYFCPQCAADADCQSTQQCASGSCQACPPVACDPPPPPPGCMYQQDPNYHCGCHLQLVCPKCAFDGQCAPNQTCVNGTCSTCPAAPRCLAPPPGCSWQPDPNDHCGCGQLVCKTCTDDCGCPPNLACANGTCQPLNRVNTCGSCTSSANCQPTQACLGGVCQCGPIPPCAPPPPGCYYSGSAGPCPTCGTLVCDPCANVSCPAGQQCSNGQCVGAMCSCPGVYAPVCGADGRTYPSACDAQCTGTVIRHTGACGAACCAQCPGPTAQCADPSQKCLGSECLPKNFCFTQYDCPTTPPTAPCPATWACLDNACIPVCGTVPGN